MSNIKPITYSELLEMKRLRETKMKLEADLMFPKSPTISDMPKAPINISNRLEGTEIKLDQIRSRLTTLNIRFLKTIATMDNIKDKHWQVLKLKYLYELKPNQISKLTKYSDKQVRRICSRFIGYIKRQEENNE